MNILLLRHPLSWDSKPSTTSQTVNETEPNGTFGSPILRSRFKIATILMLVTIVFHG